MKKILILGSGQVGKTLANLFKIADVTIADCNKNAFDGIWETIKLIESDLSDVQNIKNLVKDYDFIFGALPSKLGYQTLKAVIESGKNYCDVSFMKEDPSDLKQLAKDKGVVAVVDCGFAPGLSNMIVGHELRNSTHKKNIKIYAGGLPLERIYPFEYKITFSPADIIQEYIRPARLIENSQIIEKPALSDVELLNYENFCTLEAFNTDGLRSLLNFKDKVFNMSEKTLRYPGHVKGVQFLKDCGFFSENSVLGIKPIDLTTAIFNKKLQFDDWENDISILRVDVEDGNCWDVCVENTLNIRSIPKATATVAFVVGKLLMSQKNLLEPSLYFPEELTYNYDLFEQIETDLFERYVYLDKRNDHE